MLGLGVMISQLGGVDEADIRAYQNSIGKVIARLTLENEVLRLTFNDGTGLRFWDDGQSCCESRYMRTDDELPQFEGGVFNGVEIRDADNLATEYDDEHELQFLLVNTSNGVITFSNHNEHNGYYGGFALRVAGAQSDA